MKTSFPKDKIEVLLLEGIHADGVDMLSREGFSVRAEPHALEPDELAEAVSTAHLIGIRSKSQLTPEILKGANRLLAVGCFCIGTNQVALDAAADLAIPVFNAPFSNTRSVAELTIAEIIMLSRRTFERSSGMHEGKWIKSASRSHEVRGKTLGIIGYGHIGSQVSVLAEALGMRVVYFDLTSKLPLGNAVQCETMGEVLKQSDFITLHVPATELTDSLIGPAELSQMKLGAHLINNARGKVVDLDALAASIKAGRVGGAALDVFPEEPSGKEAPFESPLRGLPNVILTPHIGGSTIEAQANISVEVASKLLKFMNNGSTSGSVNLPQLELPEQAKTTVMSEGEEHRPHRILNFHHNVPGVLSKINSAISDLGVNVASQRLETRGHTGYVVLDVDPSNAGELTERMNQIPETIRTRVLW